jgi:CRISPR-associated endonuclease/helicase Cas3
MLHFVAREQKRGEEPRPIRVTELSATTQRAHGTVLTLEPQDEKDVLVRQRLDARKQLKVHLIEESKIVDVIAGLASAHESIPSKVLLYVRAPADAQKLAASLEKRLGRDARGRIALLTGTIRGHERDDLVNANPVYLAFLDGQARPERTIYLVSTSAGEVGIDLDADHLLCDMTTLDSMIQRLGRVNRRGGDGRSAEVDVVAASEESSKSPDPRRVSTLAILRSLPSSGGERRDASPRALRAMMASLTDEGKEAAWSAQSDALSMSDILLDSWALTSIRQGLPGRPEVAAYLHGLTNDPPETYVAWRSEVALLVQADAGRQQLTGWFRSCRIKAGERLRDRTVSVKQNLEALLKAHRRKNGSIDFSTFVLDERGEVEQALLSQVVTEQFDLRYRTVVLPVEAGGLSPYGILDSASLEPVLDVGDQPGVSERTIETESRPLISSLTEKYRIVLHGSSEDGEEGEGKYLVLLVGREQSALDHPETTAACQSLVAHSQQIGECAEQVVRALGFEQSLSDALVIAARRHDHGKAHPVWQRFACNRDAEHPLAKSTRYLHGRALAGYRHELGSLLESVRDPSLLQHPERDLILHLISSHHGWARPHFDPRAFDSRFTTAENEYETHEVMRRFARLQRRFGRWGLAWLESLLRCADIAASRAAVEHTNEEKTAS